MLARPNRLTRGAEYKAVVRRGRRCAGAHTVTYVSRAVTDGPARFGFIVSKAVGGAVTRNLVKRRLRSVAADRLRAGFRGADVVVRAIPGADHVSYANLESELCSQLGLTPSEQVTA